MNDIYYKHENKNNTIAIILVAVITILVMTPIGFITSTLALMSDSWWIDWFVAAMYGFVAALLINSLVKLFKVTATNKLRILFIVIGIILTYNYVLGYVWALLNHVGEISVLDVIASDPVGYLVGLLDGVFHPIDILPTVIEIANSLLGSGSESFFFGLAIYAYMIAIPLLIVFTPSQHLKPFDFEANKWMKKRRYQRVFAPLGRNTIKAPELRKELEAGDLTFFRENVWEAKNRNWTELYLYLDQFNEANGLIDVMAVVPGGRGSIQRNSAVQPIHVDKNKLRTLLSELENHD